MTDDVANLNLDSRNLDFPRPYSAEISLMEEANGFGRSLFTGFIKCPANGNMKCTSYRSCLVPLVQGGLVERSDNGVAARQETGKLRVEGR